MKGIFIDITDLTFIYGVKYRQAKKRMSLLRDALEKQNITIREFCEYEGITIEDYKQAVIIGN